MITKKQGVLVCGSGFGKIYVDAINNMDEFYLSGILGNGGERSKLISKDLNVSYFTDPEDPNINADLACVIIPNSGAGGTGYKVAKKLLKKGISTLLEHPAHESEIVECMKNSGDTKFMLNPFYRYTKPFKKFLEIANFIKKYSELLNASLECSINVLYDGIDMLGCCIDSIAYWELGNVSEVPRSVKNKVGGKGNVVLNANVGGLPVSFRINREIDKYNPDHPMHLYHKIELTFSSGRLCLVNTNGPIVWIPFLEIPRDINNFLFSNGDKNLEMRIPSAVTVDFNNAPSIEETFNDIWIDAVQTSLKTLDSQTKNDKLVQAQFQVLVSRLWSDISSIIGYTDLLVFEENENTQLLNDSIMKNFVYNENSVKVYK